MYRPDPPKEPKNNAIPASQKPGVKSVNAEIPLSKPGKGPDAFPSTDNDAAALKAADDEDNDEIITRND